MLLERFQMKAFAVARAGSVALRAVFFQAEDGIRDKLVTGVQTCALPIWPLRRQERAHLVDALPHPDRRRLADRAAALEQHRPRCYPGSCSSTRRHAVAAHRLLR